MTRSYSVGDACSVKLMDYEQRLAATVEEVIDPGELYFVIVQTPKGEFGTWAGDGEEWNDMQPMEPDYMI